MSCQLIKDTFASWETTGIFQLAHASVFEAFIVNRLYGCAVLGSEAC